MLARAGFRQIELSGGTEYYTEWKRELLELKAEYDLSYLLHNYFPPPESPFILNLASLDDAVFQRSLEFYLEAVSLSHELGGERYGLHAGILFDPKLNQIGKPLDKSALFSREEAISRFIHGFHTLEAAAGDVTLYIENHVLSGNNAQTFGHEKPLMMLTADDFRDLRSRFSFRPLVDLAHLYVTSESLGLNFQKEAAALLPHTDYIHLSGNDGESDSNRGLKSGSPILAPLKGLDLTPTTLSIEVYNGLDSGRTTYETISEFVK